MIQLSEKYCPKCGAKLPIDANFCLSCGTSVKTQTVSGKAKTGFLTATGVLLIIASCFSAVNGIVAFMVSLLLLTYHGGFHLRDPSWYMLAFGVLALVSSFMGLTAGSKSFKRKQFGLVVSGAAMLLITSIWQFLANPFPGGYWPGYLAILVFILSLPGLILVINRRREFA